MKTKRKTGTIIVVIIILLLIASAVFYFFIYAKTCKNEECFLTSLRECKRATYISSNEGNIWKYSIQNPFGFFQDKCTVNVKNVAIASQEELAKKLEGKGMQCRIPIEYAGTFIDVQSKLEFCNGPLKESLQDLLIDKLYKFIIQNIGEITEEIRRS